MQWDTIWNDVEIPFFTLLIGKNPNIWQYAVGEAMGKQASPPTLLVGINNATTLWRQVDNIY